MTMREINSLADLRRKAEQSDEYARLALRAAGNLGKECINLNDALNWLETNAMETSESGVVDEVNFLI